MILQLKRLRIIFFGTEKFAAYHLYNIIYCSSHKIIAVFTQEMSNSRQKHGLLIHKISQAHRLLLFQTNTLSMSNIACIINKLNVDLIIVVSYGLILSKEILSKPTLGCINVHGSLLPRWRGPAPIQRALEHGDTVTGISIIKMNSGIDTGKILYSVSCKISPTDTSQTLSTKLAFLGSKSLLITIDKLILNKYTLILQNSSQATYAYKLNKKEARINWYCSAIELERRIRAFNPWPTSYFQIGTKRIKVWNAFIFDKSNDYSYIPNIKKENSNLLPGSVLKSNASGIYVMTGSGILVLTILQIEGKKKNTVKNILNAYYKWFLPYSRLD